MDNLINTLKGCEYKRIPGTGWLVTYHLNNGKEDIEMSFMISSKDINVYFNMVSQTFQMLNQTNPYVLIDHFTTNFKKVD